MTKIISGLIFLPTLLLAQSATPTPEPENTVRVEEEVAPVLTGEDLYRSLIHTYANYYDVSETDMVRVVECESGWVPDVQSGILYTQGQITATLIGVKLERGRNLSGWLKYTYQPGTPGKVNL